MKKLIILLALAFVSNIGFSQSSIFDKLEDLEDVSVVVVTKDLFDLIRKFPDAQSEEMEFFNTAKGLQELKVFSTENASIAADMEKMVNKAIKNSSLTQLMRVKDKGSRVKIYIKSTKNKDIVSEVLMFVKDLNKNERIKGDKINLPSSTIISLTGEINMNELSKIANDYQKRSE
ncbi:DUF4252 domain-containing protein [Tenacibaculum jejuense]|uniref:DUF4252 domain-containing protein n=1 Tax=Tenacibaculum jejuense TaxID=584609 RepID=A0A238UC24_9FLAO|nr:DUF4252 domain-containing protein [Tenacibaculum jejuense]SNR16024.1 conserved exported protein of unknown function [Tenacibaculum jejuense]